MLDEAPPFDFWSVPGRKSLVHDGRRLILRTRIGRGIARLAISLSLAQGAAYAFAVPAGRTMRARAGLAADLADALAGEPPQPRGRGAAVSRTSMVHMRALQALDAADAGASERDLARLMFGSAESGATWNASAMRANVRYLLRHGRALRDGGYRALLAATD